MASGHVDSPESDIPYSRTGVSSAIPCSSGPWALDLETLNSRQRLGQTLNTLRFRVRLSEYYNFGRIDRTWSTWLLFWSRKWPSEASNHHFSPLRGLCEGCALPGAEEIFIDLGGGAPKTPTFYAKLTEIRLSLSSPRATGMMDGLRNLDP